jgi:acetyl esterase/lipase
MRSLLRLTLTCTLLGASLAPAQTSAPAPAAAARALPAGPAPTRADVAYGPHARNILDFWAAPGADAAHPAPVVVFFHGGGFVGGDKSGIRRGGAIAMCLDAGLSFAAVNYRFLGRDTPLQAILRDGARAIQFLRAHAAEWHIDPTRVAAHGDSAGAGLSLWLAVHPDLADPANADPVLRESTRLACAGLNSPQFSYDWLRWRETFGDDAIQRFGGIYNTPLLYGFATMEALRGPEGQAVRADCDMLALISKDTPPLYIRSSLPTLALENSNQFLHHPKHGQLLYERCRELGVTVVAEIPALHIAPPAEGPRSWRDLLFATLGVKRGITKAN